MPLAETAGPDPGLDAVEAKLRMLAGRDPVEKFARAIRQSIDEVLDGQRTGRWSIAQLAKTEKTYIGTKVEIVTRTFLGLEPGPILDLDIDGHPVDIKWGMNSGWQIPQEAIAQICLCVGGLENLSRFQVGLVRCREEYLNPGKNRDQKRTISPAGREVMRLLVPSSPLPPNFVEQMDEGVRTAVMAEPTVQARVTRLFTLLPKTPIPRNAVATVAKTPGDPMRRLRADKGAGNPLGGMRVFSSKFGNPLIEALGYQRLGPNEFMSIPEAEVYALPMQARKSLPKQLRRRLGFD